MFGYVSMWYVVTSVLIRYEHETNLLNSATVQNNKELIAKCFQAVPWQKVDIIVHIGNTLEIRILA